MKKTKIVKPKKHLGQHFLTNNAIAQQIANLLPAQFQGQVLEVGPGMGVLTTFLAQTFDQRLTVFEIDPDSVVFLKNTAYAHKIEIVEGDFLLQSLEQWGNTLAVIGNFPYNISSQIFFHLLEYKDQVEYVVCMLQKEVADRLASLPGKKSYGILSVFLQMFYSIEKVLVVEPDSFHPPPKVRSAVIKLTRNKFTHMDCDEKLFKVVVKTAFNQRRKTLKNALRPIVNTNNERLIEFMDKRAEQLSCSDFIRLTKVIQSI